MNALTRILKALWARFKPEPDDRTCRPDGDVYAAIGLAISNAMR